MRTGSSRGAEGRAVAEFGTWVLVGWLLHAVGWLPGTEGLGAAVAGVAVAGVAWRLAGGERHDEPPAG